MSKNSIIAHAPIAATAKLHAATSSIDRVGNGPALRAIHRVFVPIRMHWIVSAVVTMFFATALVVPTLASVPLSDDWIYARSVQILLNQHSLHILDISVSTVVFQVFWGALFASIFGMTFGVLRISTIVMVALGSLALYHLSLELGVNRQRSALGAAVYLFNPLSFALSYSFMTDPHFTALLTISTLFYVRGVKKGDGGKNEIIIGSVAAALAFLVRQQGALIPVAIATYLLLSGRIRLNFRAISSLLRVGGIPAFALVAYYLWLQFVNGVPHWQQGYLQIALNAGWRGFLLLIFELVFIGVIYLGFFVLPIAFASISATPQLLRPTSRLGLAIFACWMLIVVLALGVGIPDGMIMPYIPHFLSVRGLGPSDLLANATQLFSHQFFVAVTIACGVATMMFIIALCGQTKTEVTPDRAGAGVLLSLGVWQAIGALPPSFPFRNGLADGHIAPSLDRYLLPLLPLAICLSLWATREARLMLPLAWAGVAAFAVFAVMGTRDALVLQQATWQLDQTANQMGISNLQLDGGAAWDGYYLYEYSQTHHSETQTPLGAPLTWWLSLWAPATDSSYVVAAQPIPQYTLIKRVSYSSWLRRDPSFLYLLQRQHITGDS